MYLMLLSWSLLAADAPTTTLDIAPILPAIQMIGSLGFTAWYAWYVTTVSMPKKDEQHAKEREADAAQCAKERATEAERYERSLKLIMDEWRSQREQIDRMLSRP